MHRVARTYIFVLHVGTARHVIATSYLFPVLQNWEEFSINRGSYMSAHVLLNLLNKLGKRDKMRGLPSILSLFSQRV